MDVQANNDNISEENIKAQATQEGQANDLTAVKEAVQSPTREEVRTEGKSYGKKFSARIYKYFSLLTFFIYYLNFMLRIGMRCSSYFKSQGINSIPSWWALMQDKVKFGEMCGEIFDWYTITLLVFLFLYSAVFLITFIRFSPKNKKTFKYFKKGFLMARRVIKLISVGLTLTVLVNSAQLATFSDKFMFVISLLSIIFTFMQICISLITWIIGRKLNRSVKQYVGNVMTNYLANARVRPQQQLSSNKLKATVGDKLGKAKDRFLRTIETLTLSNEEAMRRAAETDGYVVDNNEITERFENDYKPDAEQELEENKSKKKPKKEKHIFVKREKTSIIHKKVKSKPVTSQAKANSVEEEESKQVASDISQDESQNKENHESTT